MINFKIKDNLLVGILIGMASLIALFVLFTAIDMIVYYYMDRPLFIRPDAKQLLMLATLILIFRNQVKDGQVELAKGFYLALFCSVMLYLVQKKTNFASW